MGISELLWYQLVEGLFQTIVALAKYVCKECCRAAVLVGGKAARVYAAFTLAAFLPILKYWQNQILLERGGGHFEIQLVVIFIRVIPPWELMLLYYHD